MNYFLFKIETKIKTNKKKRCEHNTYGDKCQYCKPGFVGDARRGTPYDCKPAMPQMYQSVNQDSYDRSVSPGQKYNRRQPTPKPFPQRIDNRNKYPTFVQQNNEMNNNLQMSDADEEDQFFDQLF